MRRSRKPVLLDILWLPAEMISVLLVMSVELRSCSWTTHSSQRSAWEPSLISCSSLHGLCRNIPTPSCSQGTSWSIPGTNTSLTSACTTERGMAFPTSPTWHVGVGVFFLLSPHWFFHSPHWSNHFYFFIGWYYFYRTADVYAFFL